MLGTNAVFSASSGNKNTEGKESGFSLIEVSIALVIIGLIMVPMFMQYRIDIASEQQIKTTNRMANIQAAVNQSLFAGAGAYPCPASLIIGEGDPDHGVPFTNCADFNAIRLCTAPEWDDDDGICKTSATQTDAVLIGAVPFNTLSLSPKDTLDTWGNKILYAVTYEQTNPATFNSNTGRIVTWAYADHDNNTATDPVMQNISSATNPIDFILLSHGEGGAGAYSSNGQLISSCPTLATAAESMNCDMDNTFLLEDNGLTNRIGSRSLGTNTRYYDDLTRTQDNPIQEVWFPHPLNTDHVMTLSTRVGVGVDTPQYTLDVGGEIQANGALKSDRLCTADYTNCFETEFVTTQHDCVGDSNAGTVRMFENSLKCGSPVAEGATGTALHAGGQPFRLAAVKPDGTPSPYQFTPCPDFHVLRGFDSSGAPICITK